MRAWSIGLPESRSPHRASILGATSPPCSSTVPRHPATGAAAGDHEMSTATLLLLLLFICLPPLTSLPLFLYSKQELAARPPRIGLIRTRTGLFNLGHARASQGAPRRSAAVVPCHGALAPEPCISPAPPESSHRRPPHRALPPKIPVAASIPASFLASRSKSMRRPLLIRHRTRGGRPQRLVSLRC